MTAISKKPRTTFTIVGIYAVVASVWIYTSDTLLGLLFRNLEDFVLFSKLKGFAFIMVTSSLLYYLVARYTRQCRKAEDKLERMNRELEIHVEERTVNLAESETRFRALVLATSQVVFRMSPDWREMRELLATDLDSKNGCLVSDWLQKYVHPEDQSRVLQAVAKAIQEKSIFEMEHRVATADGSTSWTFSRAVPLLDTSGEIIEWFGAASDVTKRKAAEESLRDAYQQLEVKSAEQLQAVEELRKKDLMLIEQNRLAAMGELLNNIAHHWRQPLNLLGLCIQEVVLCMQRGDCSGEIPQKSLEKAMATLRELSKTVDQFRQFFVLDSEGRLFRVNTVVEKTISLLADTFSDQGVLVEMITSGDPHINGSPSELSQVLLSILMNSKDAFQERATKRARVIVWTGVENGRAVVTIRDNGGGISDDILGKIFDPFFTTKDVGKGTGLNLFVSKNIVEKNLGGQLTVRNTDGGVEFRIEI